MTCDLHSTCGVLCRTYSAYKFHIYRRHSSELHSEEKNNNRINATLVDDQQQENIDILVKSDLTNSDEDNYELDFVNNDLDSMSLNDDYEAKFYDSALSSDATSSYKISFGSPMDIKRPYVLFILQIREEFLLPKNITSTNYFYLYYNINAKYRNFIGKKCA